MSLQTFCITSAGISDVGLVRSRNEDAWSELPDKGFFVLADGMGGHQGGDVAAQMTVDIVSKIINQKVNSSIDPDEGEQIVADAILAANHEILKRASSEDSLKGMGSTVCCLLVTGEKMVWGNLGDSRIYRVRKELLAQVSEDDSLIGKLVRTHQLSPQEAEGHPLSHVITQAVGTDSDVQPETGQIGIQSGDLYMLCSDGLSDYVPHKEIEALLNKPLTLQEKCQKLVDLSCKVGGEDNVTLVLVQVSNGKDLPR